MYKKLKIFFKKNYLILLIISIALFQRFYNYSARYILNQDQGRDASIALYSNRNNLLTLIGSPSSAGPFNFGPWYFWLIMIFQKISPVFIGPWIGFTFLSVVAVVLYYKIGKIYFGSIGGFIFGMIAATSPLLVAGSSDLLNTVIIIFSSSVAFLTTAIFFKKNKLFYLIFSGFFVGISINFHFQSLGLLSLLLFSCLINKFSVIKRFKMAIFSGLGLIISFIPLITFDIQNNNIWIKSVVEYYTVGVNKFYAPVRWLTEIKDFWPQFFGTTIIGIPVFGYLIILLGVIAIFLKIKSREKIDLYWFVVFISFLFQVILMRFYKGVRSSEYLIAFYPFVILIFGWILTTLYYYKKNLVIIFIILISIFNTIFNLKRINKYPSQSQTIHQIKKEIDLLYKNDIRLYKYKDSYMIAMPLFYLYYYQNRIDNSGQGIGVCETNKYVCPSGEIHQKNNYKIYNMESLTSTESFDELTPKSVYQILMVNYKKY